MTIFSLLQKEVSAAVAELYGHQVDPSEVLLNNTRSEFEGDYTVVVFPFTRAARKKPEQIGEELGTRLQERLEQVSSFNVIKGFLNLSLSGNFWKSFLQEVSADENYGQAEPQGAKVMVEFSSPNTNKPLHLGHIRNILLGWATAQIMEAAGYEVIKTQIVNDRGIAICRSMLAWQKFGEGATPESTGIKGDHFVGKYYVEFARRFEEEYQAWQKSEEAGQVYRQRAEDGQDEAAFFKAYKNDYFNEYSTLGAEAREMLIQWEAGDPKVRALWEQMNSWVYRGFDETYDRLGVHFDKLYYESETYLLGKELIDQGIQKGILQQDDKRVWVDLEEAKLGHKTIIKSDGTSTYTSQDLGTAHQRYKDFRADQMIYVVADEQNNHFQVLFEILRRLGEPYADGLHHLSYGMVDLPSGRMKSREGTVVDADDLMREVIEVARKEAEELGGLADASEVEKTNIYRKVGLSALKYFILKVNPRKRMTFNPEESVELQGQTGPYIQYSYVRVRGVGERGRKEGVDLGEAKTYQGLEPAEKDLLKAILEYPGVIRTAAEEYDPSHLASSCYNLAKLYSKFWHDLSIFGAKEEGAVAFRLLLSEQVGRVLQHGMELLGIEMPERM